MQPQQKPSNQKRPRLYQRAPQPEPNCHSATQSIPVGPFPLPAVDQSLRRHVPRQNRRRFFPPLTTLFSSLFSLVPMCVSHYTSARKCGEIKLYLPILQHQLTQLSFGGKCETLAPIDGVLSWPNYRPVSIRFAPATECRLSIGNQRVFIFSCRFNFSGTCKSQEGHQIHPNFSQNQSYKEDESHFEIIGCSTKFTLSIQSIVKTRTRYSKTCGLCYTHRSCTLSKLPLLSHKSKHW